ncbi:HECT domain ubiquitin transferase (macronuclear) [Tetrahymena thermophila SB210]|uniref:HECT-type E3 ubiquitin transferase n=1 Tax=Tetrahymena thermophila (strain SB210) TaxID=312017 RepID=I7LSY2_TETTS|nr:HECT domain ubiquitin transferase [Tetrahymena thermophila SB210]EAR83836.2 HECT domain ubiquitin transferase [Tetrahymena thermophila SB210]|eukprot:XP_001031499.2 HECT domain ubiquitin transferase [Tetrahymena thermophila SB210]
MKKDEAKLKDYLERVKNIKSEEDAINFFKYNTTKKNFHHQNQRPIDKIEFISMFELYDKIINSLVKQLEKCQEQEDNTIQCAEIEKKIADILNHYQWLLLTGKNRWSEEKLKDFIDLQCSYLVNLFALSFNPAVYFQIYKAIPINDYELEDRNQILAFLSHYDKNIDTMKQNLHDYFINCLNIDYPVHDNQKLYDEKVELFLQITENEYIQKHSSYSIIRKITQEILKPNKNESSSQKMQTNLICCLIHYIKLSLSSEFINSPFHSIMQCMSLLTQIYYDDKKKYKNKYKSLEFLKIKGEGAKELFEEISQYIEKYKDTEHVQYILDFLANLEYPKLFCSDVLAPIYEKSSLFYKYELFFCNVLEDIYEHCNQDTQLKYPISKVVLSNTMNLKDFIEISLQNVESLRYLMKTFQNMTQIQQQTSNIQRQNLIDLHQKLLNLHKQIYMSFARSEWIFDVAILEIYLAFSGQVFPEFYRFDMQSELQIKCVELIVKYVRKNTMLHCKYKNNRREVSVDEFFFMIKVYLKLIEENISSENYEEYLNNLFFNIEDLVQYCAEKRNEEGENTVSCLLLNLCFKSSNIEQMENYFNWKVENKVAKFEQCIDLFLKQGIQVYPYFDNFITCFTEKILNQNENLRGIYTRMIVKYNFCRLFDNSNSQVQLKLKKEGYDISIIELKNQIEFQIKNAIQEKNMLKKYFRELNLKEIVDQEYSFLYKRIIFWNNLKYEKMMVNTKGLLTSISNYASEEENTHHHLFKIYYEYSLQFVQFITCFTKKNLIGNHFSGINLNQKQIVQTFNIQQNIINLFQDKKDIIDRVGKYLLRVNSKEKFIDQLCSDEEEKIHNISQQTIVYLNYIAHSPRNLKLDSQVFTLLIDIIISVFYEFSNNNFNLIEDSKQQESQLLKKIDQVYIKNINIFNKFGQSFNQLQKEINTHYLNSIKNNELNDTDKSLNQNESPLVREKFFDLIQFSLSMLNNVSEKPENIIKFSVLLDKILQITSLTYKKTGKVGSNLNERYILMCQCLSRTQNDKIIQQYFEKILPSFQELVSKCADVSQQDHNKKHLSYVKLYQQKYTNIFSDQIILNEFMNNDDIQIDKINLQLGEISQLENKIIKVIDEKSEKICSKFDYLEQILKLEVIEKEQFAQKMQEQLIEKLEDLIKENQYEINQLASLLKSISLQAHPNSIQNRKQNNELILAIVSSLQHIIEPYEFDEQNIDQECSKEQSSQLKFELLLLYFIDQVQYKFDEKTEESLVEQILQKLLLSVNKNIPLNIYKLYFSNSILMKRLQAFSKNQFKYSKRGIALYNHLCKLVNESNDKSQQSEDKNIDVKPAFVASYLQLLTQFIDLHNSGDILYIISQLLSQCQQHNNLYDSIFYILCNILKTNEQFYSDSILCKIAIIDKINYINNLQQSNNNMDDFILENDSRYIKEQSPVENIISYKVFLEKYSVYFFAPSYYQEAVNTQQIRELIQKERKFSELKNLIQEIKNKKYFEQNELSIQIMKIIIDNEKTNIRLLHILVNLFPQVIFIFKDNLTEIISQALNVEYNINSASNFIQNVFEIVSIDQEFLEQYKSCLIQKLKEMIEQEISQAKLIEVAQLIFPMEKKYQRLLINYLAQQIKFEADNSKNYSLTNSQRWNLDYFNNLVYQKQLTKASNTQEEPNKFISQNLSKHIGSLLQNKEAYSSFFKEYQALMNSLGQDKERIFDYKNVVIQRDFGMLENLIESACSTFTQYHQQVNSNSQQNQQQKQSPQKEVPQIVKQEINNQKTKIEESKSKVEVQKKTPESSKSKEEKKEQSEDEWESEEGDDSDEDSQEKNRFKNDKIKEETKSQQDKDDNKNDEDEWEDDENDNESENSVEQDDQFQQNKKKESPKQKDEDDEDSSDYDHEGEKKQSGKKIKENNQKLENQTVNDNSIKPSESNQKDLSKIKDGLINQIMEKITNITEENFGQQSGKKLKDIEEIQNQEEEENNNYQDDEEGKIDDFAIDGYRDNEARDQDGEEEYKMQNVISFSLSENDQQEDEEEEEDEEKIKTENEFWNKYLVLKERWNVAKYYNIDKKEQEAMKQQIFEFLRDLRRQKEKIAIFVDIVKQLDEDDLKRYLHTKFPKFISLKGVSTKKNKKNKKQNQKDEKNKNQLSQVGNAFEDFTSDKIQDEEKKNDNNNNNEDDEYEELDEDEESNLEDGGDEEEEEEDEDERNLLHISSSEEDMSEEENEFDEDEDEYDEDEENSYYNQYGNGSGYHSESSHSQQDSHLDDEDDDHHDENSDKNKSLNDRQWSPVISSPNQENLIKLYMENLVYYDEKAIENIIQSFYFGSFSQIISNELLNPVHGPQLMDALFFLLVNPQLDKYEELKNDKDLEFFAKLGEKQLFLKNYLLLYDNSMSFFRNTFCTNQQNELLAYFTLDASHWQYLPQLSVIKKLKKITNYQQMSGLQTLIMLFGDKFKYVDIYENKKQIQVLNQISKFIKSTHIDLGKSVQDTPSQSQITIYSPVIRQIDIDNILHYYYFENLHFNTKSFLYSFLKKGLNSHSKYTITILEQFIESQSKFLIQDVIDLMNKGISDVQRILQQQDPNSKKFALSHLYEIFSDTEFNPIYESFKSFAANLRTLMRLYFKRVKKIEKSDQKAEMIKLQEVLNNQNLMKLFTHILRQLQYLHSNIIGIKQSGSTSVLDNDENGELQQIFQSFIPIVKLMYMLHPYYDIDTLVALQLSDVEQSDSLPELARISSKQQSSAKFEAINQNKLIEIVNEEEDKILKVDEFKRILEQGFCQIIKLFVGMDNQLFQKYIRVVSKDPQNLRSLDLDTRLYAIHQKAVKRAQKEQDCTMEIITLKVDRKCVFEDTFKTIMRQKPHQLIQKQFEVKFRKEDGIDQSGLTREWYSCISKELFDPRKGLFRVSSNKYIVYPSTTSYLVPDHITLFKFSGQIIAKSVLEGYLVGVDFPKFILKHLTGQPLKISDLDDIEPELTKNLLWILENPVEDLCLTFIYEFEEIGNKKTIELINGGKNIDVTDQNKKDYVDKLINYVMIQQIQPQIQSFLEGFFSIFPKSELYLVDWMELGTKIAGAQEIDFKELRANTTYQGGYSEISTLIQWFWEILMTFDDKMKRKFLFFLSGSYKIPLGGYKDMGFTISKIFDTQNLPVAHTCFNQLDLPQYEDKEILQKKLFQAILDGNESFGIA